MENDDYSDIESEEIDNLDYQDDDNPSFDEDDYYGSDEDSSFYDESTDINDNESYRATRNRNVDDDKVTETTNQDDNSSQNSGSEQQGNKQDNERSGSSSQNDSASGEQSDNKEDNKQNAKQDDGKESGESAEKDVHTPEKDGSQNGDDDNSYKAGGSGGVDPNELKEGFGRDEFAKTVGNKDYYKNQRDGLKDRLDNAKKKRKELNNNGNNQQNQQQGDSAKPQDNQQNQQQGDPAKPQDNQQNQQQGDLAKPQNNQQNQQHGEKPDDKQKKEEEKAARKAKRDAKKEEREAKRALVKNGIASAKAKAYEATHPLEAARIKAKNWLKNKIISHPFLTLLIVVGVMIVLIVFVILISFSDSGGASTGFNKFDYEANIRVTVDGEKYRLFAAVASMVYYDTFISGDADAFDNLSDSQKTEAVKALFVKRKTEVLLKNGWNPDKVKDEEYIVNGNSFDFCNYSYGCYKDIFGGFHQYDSEDFEARTDDVDIKYPGLLNYKSDDTKNYNKASIVFDAMLEVSGYIIVPSDVTGILSDLCNKDGKCTNSVDISELKTDAIITAAAGGSSYDSIIKTLIDTDDKTYNPSYSIQNHLYRDTSIVSYGGDGGNSYYDYGYSEPVEGIDFWWPVGSKNADSNNLYSGTPVSVNITSYYGARWSSFHEGIDINSSDDDTPIIAISDGMVERAYCESKCNNNPKPSCIAESAYGKTYTCIEGNMYTGSGCQVLVNHGTMPDGSNIKSLYVHLKAGSIVVSAGQRVVKGQRLGTMGSTGCSTGRHLHFGIYTNNGYTHVNPLNFVSPDNPRR